MIKMRETQLFCQKVGDRYRNFYKSEKIVKTCGDTEPIIPVIVRELPQPTENCYWGFWFNDTQSFSFVYKSLVLLDICFAGGYKEAEKRGDGFCLPVEIITQS